MPSPSPVSPSPVSRSHVSPLARRHESGFLQRPDGAGIWFQRHRVRSADPAAGLVVLCAPGGRNAAYWPPGWIDEFAVSGHDVVRFDWRHQGRSVTPVALAHDRAAEVMATDLVALCRHLLPPRAPGLSPARLTLVGVGLGGWVAARAAQNPDVAALGPRRLVLVGSSRWFADPTMPGPSEPVVVALVMRRRGSGPTDLLRALSREVSAECGGPGPLDGQPLRARVETWLAHGFNPEDPHWANWLAAPPLDLPWPRSEPSAISPGRLSEQIVVLHGQADPVVPLAHGEDLARRLGAPMQVVAGVGHHVEEPMLRAIAANVLDRSTPRSASRSGSPTHAAHRR